MDDLSLEKLRINDRLQAVELQVARLVAHLESETGTVSRLHTDIYKNLSRLELLINRHDELLLGNGTPGMKVDVDRLKQSEESRKWHLGFIWPSLVTLIGKAIWDILKR